MSGRLPAGRLTGDPAGQVTGQVSARHRIHDVRVRPDRRRRAGLTQAALADRAGTSAPTISAYEHAARQPRADALLRLRDAAGVEPALVPTSRDPEADGPKADNPSVQATLASRARARS